MKTKTHVSGLILTKPKKSVFEYTRTTIITFLNSEILRKSVGLLYLVLWESRMSDISQSVLFGYNNTDIIDRLC